MLRRFLTSEAEELLQAERRQLVGLRTPLASLEASPNDLATLDRALLQLDELFLLVIVGRVQLRQVGVHQRAAGPARPGRRRHPDHRADPPPEVRRRAGPAAGGARHAGRDVSGGMAARHQHRGHAGHQRRDPPPPGDHRGLRPARRPGALRHLGRPALQRERAGFHRAHPRVGQEGRLRRQQDRHPGDPRRHRARDRVRDDERPRDDRPCADRFRRIQPAGAAGQGDVRRRRADAPLGRQPFRAAGGLHPPHAGSSASVCG